MILSVGCVLMSLLFVFSVRRREKILSALIAVEAAVLTLILAVVCLSAVGGGTRTEGLLIVIAWSVCSKTTILGASVSSLMVIQAIAVLLVCFISLYYIYGAVKKAFKSKNRELRRAPDAKNFSAYNLVDFSRRKVFLLNCRLNN